MFDDKSGANFGPVRRPAENLAICSTAKMKGLEGSNPPLSATESILFPYNLEIMANPRGTRGFCAQCEREKAISLQKGSSFLDRMCLE